MDDKIKLLERGDRVLYEDIVWTINEVWEDIFTGLEYQLKSLNGDLLEINVRDENIIPLPKDGDEEVIKALYYD